MEYTEEQLVSFGNYLLSDEVRDIKLNGLSEFVSHADIENFKLLISGRSFKKKPVMIEAIQYTGDNTDDILEFGDGDIIRYNNTDPRPNNPSGKFCYVKTREGMIVGIVGDWFIKGVEGEFYPCGDDIFKKTYEKP